MDQIPGVDLKKVFEQSEIAFRKVAEAKLAAYLSGQKINEHNARMAAKRLRADAEMHDLKAEKFRANIAAIAAGDWSGVEDLALDEKKG